MNFDSKTATDMDSTQSRFTDTLDDIYRKWRSLESRAIATFAPPLEDKGNSVRCIRVFEELTESYCLHFVEAMFRANRFGLVDKAASGSSSDFDA